jgi:lycopene beta-cyclase
MTTAPHRFDADVAIVGGGPAGWALAWCVAQQGLRPLVVATDPTAAWPATYGVWVDDVPPWIVDRVPPGADLFTREWHRVRVVGHTERLLSRPYARLDNEVLQRVLQAGEWTAATVRSVSHDRWGSRLHTSGDDVYARLVIDASGASSTWRAGSPRPSGAQVAYGLVVPVDAVPDPWRGEDTCTLMDWRSWHGAPPRSGELPGEASFLYVLDDEREALVEETSLVRRPPASFDELRTRLARRLGRDLTDEARAVERVHIPMAPGRVRHGRGQRVVAFGAAAGYIHPATGYSLAASLRAAPRVADALSRWWHTPNPEDLARHVATAVWPRPARRVRALHDVGLAALDRLDGNGVRTFFDAFFSLPTPLWSAYLRVDAQPRDVMRAMSAVFLRVPMRLRSTLMRAHPWGLVNAVTAGGS